MIPRTFHHIWLGPDSLPDEHRRWIKTWKRHHPRWEFRLWTEENLPVDAIRREVLEKLRAPVERADILRLELLYRYGGVYLDTDLECLRPIDDVIGDADFVGVCHKLERITNTAIASAPGHPLLERAMREIRPLEVFWTGSSKGLKEVAGPRFLQRLLADFPDVKLLEPPLFFPATAEERERAVAIHHMARVWHNTTTLRAAMLRAERRLEKVTERLEEERRAHAVTKKRLAKLEAQGRKPWRGGGEEGGETDSAEAPDAEVEAPRKRGAWLRGTG